MVLDPLQLAEEDDAKKTKQTFDTLCEYFPDLNYEDLEYHITKNQETGKINTPTHWKYLVKGVERSVKEELEKKLKVAEGSLAAVKEEQDLDLSASVRERVAIDA